MPSQPDYRSALQTILGLFLIVLSATLLALMAIVLLSPANAEPVPATAAPTSAPMTRARLGRQTPAATPIVQPVRCQETMEQVAGQTYFSNVSGTKQAYIVYVPPCYDVTPTRYPTMYLIHGAGVDDTHWESLGLFEVMDEGIQSDSVTRDCSTLSAATARASISTERPRNSIRSR